MDANFLNSILGGQPQNFGVPADVAAYAAPSPTAPPGVDQATNVLQSLAAPGMQPVITADPAAANYQVPTHVADMATAAHGAATASSESAPDPAAGRGKHSFFDILGRIGDGLARAGGVAPVYQGKIDQDLARTNAAADRVTAAGDHARGVELDNAKLALLRNNADIAMTDAEKAREGSAIQHVQAVVAAGGDPIAAWQAAAPLAGVSAERSAIIGQMIAADPKNEKGTLEGLDALRNGIEEYKTAPIQAYNPKTGEYEIVQVGSHGGKNITKLDDGFTIPSTSAVNVDAGGVRELRDPRTGRLLARTAVTASPDTIATNASHERVAAAQDASREEVTRLKANAPGKGGKGGDDDPYGAYVSGRTGLTTMRDDITALARNPNVSAATGFINGAIDTPARQAILAKIAQIEGQSAAVAISVARQGGAKNPGQKEVLAISKGLISDLHLLRQSTGSFQENAQAAVDRFNTRIQQLDDSARRRGIVGSGGGAASSRPAAPATPATPRRVLPAPAGARPGQPIVRNW